MTKQIPLDLAVTPDHSFESFVQSFSNTSALSLVKGHKNWPAPILLLLGPNGSGKTHLGQAWATSVGADVITTPQQIDDCSQYAFIDDADKFSALALFNLINKALAGEITALLLTSSHAPRNWPHSLADLSSRLKNVPTAWLDEADEALITAIIRNLFEDAGRSVQQGLVEYIAVRCERSVPALRKIVMYLESQARADKVDLTKAYAARVLNRQESLL